MTQSRFALVSGYIGYPVDRGDKRAGQDDALLGDPKRHIHQRHGKWRKMEVNRRKRLVLHLSNASTEKSDQVAVRVDHHAD
jgi:hypothetical protein